MILNSPDEDSLAHMSDADTLIASLSGMFRAFHCASWAMDVPPTVQDEQAVSRQLHSLSVRNLAHLAAALTQLGFELSRSSDPGTRQAANAFIGQLANINQDIDRQIELLSALDADNVGFRLLDEVQYPDAPE